MSKLNSITDLTYGIIVHQVNCQNKMGAGVARALYEKFSKVKTDYHTFCAKYKNPKALLGEMCFTVIKPKELCVISLFTQEYYGNRKITKPSTFPNILVVVLPEATGPMFVLN